MENNENLINASTPQTEEADTNNPYISAINEMKKNSVSRSEYEKLERDNAQLLAALREGRSIEPEKKVEVNVDELRKELFSVDCDLNNLQYIEKTLLLRDALLEKGEPDPFLPWNSKNAPTPDEINTANTAAEIFRECIEYADGDSAVFTQELQRRTVDSMPVRRKR